MVFQHFALFTRRNVIKNVEYGLKSRRFPLIRREKAIGFLNRWVSRGGGIRIPVAQRGYAARVDFAPGAGT